MRVLIAYLSYSGNTEEVAELIDYEMKNKGISADMHRIGIDPPINPEEYNRIFIGTFSWDEGATPDEVKDFVIEVGYKPNNVAVFGTGETQFGEETYCLAAEKLAKFYNSRWPALKIEQSPRGSQESMVTEWLSNVMEQVHTLAG